MAKSVGRLQIQLEAMTERFNREIEKANKTNKRMAAQMKRSSAATKGLGAAVKSLGGILSGALGARAMFNLGRAAIAMGDDIAKSSKRLGIGIETLQALQFEGQAAGIETEALHKALQKFTVGIGEVATLGTGELKPTLEALNISLFDMRGNLRSVDDLLVEFAQKAGDTESVLMRNAFAADAFGQRGLKMVELFPLLSGGLDSFVESAKAFGAVVEDDVVVALEDTQDALDRMGKAWDAAWAKTFGGIALGMGFGTEAGQLRHEIAQLEQFEIQGLNVGGDHVDRLAELREQLALVEERARSAADMLGNVYAQGPVEIRGDALPPWIQDANEQALERLEPVELAPVIDVARIMAEETEALAQSMEERRAFTMSLAEEQAAQATDEMTTLQSSILSVSSALETQLVSAIMTGKFSFEDFARSVVASIAQIITRMLIMRAIMASPLGDLMPAAKDGAVVGLPEFAAGGVVSGRQKIVAGEQGPEAILPLVRRNGKLGVMAAGSSGGSPGPISVTINNAAPHSDREAEKMAAMVSRAVSEAWKKQALNESRPGGLLNPAV